MCWDEGETRDPGQSSPKLQEVLQESKSSPRSNPVEKLKDVERRPGHLGGCQGRRAGGLEFAPKP